MRLALVVAGCKTSPLTANDQLGLTASTKLDRLNRLRQKSEYPISDLGRNQSSSWSVLNSRSSPLKHDPSASTIAIGMNA